MARRIAAPIPACLLQYHSKDGSFSLIYEMRRVGSNKIQEILYVTFELNWDIHTFHTPAAAIPALMILHISPPFKFKTKMLGCYINMDKSFYTANIIKSCPLMLKIQFIYTVLCPLQENPTGPISDTIARSIVLQPALSSSLTLNIF